jgi:predicted ribosomally synthesized peptide with nif11-like leader
MSAEAARAFGEKLQKDESFRNQVQQVVASSQQKSTAELLKVAAGAGFEFTEAELTTAVQEQIKQQHAAGELKDEELLQVAGGTFWLAFISAGVSAAIGISAVCSSKVCA